MPERLPLARNDRVAIALVDLVAYSTGITFDLALRAGPGQTLGHEVMFSLGGFWQHPSARMSQDEILRFGVEFADGRRVLGLGGEPGDDDAASASADGAAPSRSTRGFVAGLKSAMVAAVASACSRTSTDAAALPRGRGRGSSSRRLGRAGFPCRPTLVAPGTPDRDAVARAIGSGRSATPSPTRRLVAVKVDHRRGDARQAPRVDLRAAARRARAPAPRRGSRPQARPARSRSSRRRRRPRRARAASPRAAPGRGRRSSPGSRRSATGSAAPGSASTSVNAPGSSARAIVSLRPRSSGTSSSSASTLAAITAVGWARRGPSARRGAAPPPRPTDEQSP